MKLEDMLTLAVMLGIVASIAFFSQEIHKIIKKIFAIRGMPLFLPLALASIMVYEFQPLAVALLHLLSNYLLQFYHLIIAILPSSAYADSLALIIVLTLVSIIPVLLLQWHAYRKTQKAYPHPYLLSTLIWIISVLLLIS